MGKVRSKLPELLSPAGSWTSLTTAIESGCDAVYFGVKGINMRHAASNFDVLEIKKVMNLLRKKGKKGYLTLNVTVYNEELGKVRSILEEAVRARVDAVILWDMAVMSIALELGLRVHLSTQASVSNFEAVKYYASLGVKRIVLARECQLKDIERMAGSMRDEGIDCELEVFIHGAMCVSVSGRCFLSQLTFDKSANRGECLQPCRREYKIVDVDSEQDVDCEYVIGSDYVLSPKDLCTIKFIDALCEAGISSFKIEGRMRPPEYVKTVTSAYREALELYASSKLTEEAKEELLGRLKGSFNRGFSSGFFFGRPDDLGGTLEGNYEKVFLGEVKKFYKKAGVAEVKLLCGGLKVGDSLLIYGKTTPASFMEVDQMQIEHEDITEAHQGSFIGLKVPFTVRRNDKVFLWKK